MLLVIQSLPHTILNFTWMIVARLNLKKQTSCRLNEEPDIDDRPE